MKTNLHRRCSRVDRADGCNHHVSGNNALSPVSPDVMHLTPSQSSWRAARLPSYSCICSPDTIACRSTCRGRLFPEPHDILHCIAFWHSSMHDSHSMETKMRRWGVVCAYVAYRMLTVKMWPTER